MSTLVERELFSESLEEAPIQKELTWGLSYRTLKETTILSPIKPKHSPINVPFKLCQAKEKKSKKKLGKSASCPNKKNPNLSLLDRSVLTQDRYMDVLSIPQKRNTNSVKPKNPLSCKCLHEPCPPRIIQMSVPNKRYVWENWKAYQNTLPPETLMRFDQILKSGNNLEPKDARYYFKQLNKKKKKEVKKKKRMLKKKKNALKRGNERWIKEEIQATVNCIVDYIKNEPLFMLNFQQMMTSDELLKFLYNERVVKIKGRNCRCIYKKTLIEISDKLVKWMDTMSFFAEIQPVDSKEKILEVPSIESLLEEESEVEEEEEEEMEGEEQLRRKLFGEEEMEDIFGEEGVAGGDAAFEEFMARKIVDKAEIFDEPEGSLLDLLEQFDEDVLERLIQILSASPEDFLAEEIDETLPGVTYADVLAKLKEIHDGKLLATTEKVFLEDRMIEWAKNNEPESVDDKLLDKIHETSTLLAEIFKTTDSKKSGDEAFDETLVPVEEELFEKKDDKMRQLEGVKTPLEEEEEGETEDFQEAVEAQIEPLTEEDQEKTNEEKEAQENEAEEQTPVEETFEKVEITTQEATPIGEEISKDEEITEGEEKATEGEETLAEEEDKLTTEESEKLTTEEAIEETKAEDAGAGFVEGAAMGEEEEFGEEDFGLLGEEFGEEDFYLFGEDEEEEEYVGEAVEPLKGDDIITKVASELERLDEILGIIKGHKPSQTFDHEPGTICCLSLKIWAVWLLEIANNSHNWTKWLSEIIKQVRHYAACIRGDVVGANGEKKVVYKEEWRKFVKDTEEKIIAWRQYSKHVKDLSNEIMETFKDKRVTCCPKCLQDHLIKNVVTAHETFQSLTEAINCAGYWQRCLDKIVEQTTKITEIEVVVSDEEITSLKSEESYIIEIEEVFSKGLSVIEEESSGSFYEIEEVSLMPNEASSYDIVEVAQDRGIPEPSKSLSQQKTLTQESLLKKR